MSFYVYKYNNKNRRQFLIILLLFIINLRIMVPSNNLDTISSDLDVLFVIDNTVSMVAEDYDGKNTRLSGVIKDCNNIVDKLSGSNFSIITFANEANLVIPFTSDSNIAKEAIEILYPVNDFYAKGSNLNTPIDIVLNTLKKDTKHKDRKKILFFISDGEITDDSKLESYKEISKYISGGAVFGYGTKSGGYMKSTNEYGTSEYIEDNSNYETMYQKAVSKIDENNLKQISNDLKVKYYNMNNGTNVDSLLKKINKSSSRTAVNEKISNYDDLYFIFIIPLIILLGLEFDSMRRNNL